MKNQILFLLTVVALFVGFFFARPYLFPSKPRALIEDRLPDAPLIGKISVIDFIDDLHPALFKNKIAGRDIIASDFILSQTKNTGIDLQKPTYFYSIDGIKEFGVLLSVMDSSKVPRAISRIKTLFNVRDTIINTQIVHKIDKYNIYFCNENDWFFIYRGNHFVKNYYQIRYADHTSMKKRWRNFLNNKLLQKEHLSFFYRSKAMAKKRLDYLAVSVKLDSNNVYLKTIIADRYFFPIQIKKEGQGIPIEKKTPSKYFLDLHLVVDELRATQDHFIYTFLQKYARRINFPLNDFLQNWDGDLSVLVGGVTKVKESYVETEFDDNFNPKEVKKTRLVDRERLMSYMTSTKSGFAPFVNQLFARGFLTKTKNNFNLLIIPDVKLVQSKNSFMIYTGFPPKINRLKPLNEGKITYDNSEFYFKINNISKREMFMDISFPDKFLIKKYNIKIGE